MKITTIFDGDLSSSELRSNSVAIFPRVNCVLLITYEKGAEASINIEPRVSSFALLNSDGSLSSMTISQSGKFAWKLGEVSPLLDFNITVNDFTGSEFGHLKLEVLENV